MVLHPQVVVLAPLAVLCGRRAYRMHRWQISDTEIIGPAAQEEILPSEESHYDPRWQAIPPIVPAHKRPDAADLHGEDILIMERRSKRFGSSGFSSVSVQPRVRSRQIGTGAGRKAALSQSVPSIARGGGGHGPAGTVEETNMGRTEVYSKLLEVLPITYLISNLKPKEEIG